MSDKPVVHMSVVVYYKQDSEETVYTDFTMSTFCRHNSTFPGGPYLSKRPKELPQWSFDAQLKNDLNQITCMDCLAIKIPKNMIGFTKCLA